MQPLIIRIEGRYWDVFLYKGRLLLFRHDGSVICADWNRLIEEAASGRMPDVVSTCAFLQSDYLYSDRFSLLFRNEAVKTAILHEFQTASDTVIYISEEDLAKHAIGGLMDCPFPFPFAEIAVYKDKLYACGPSGIFVTGFNNRTKGPLSSTPIRLSSLPATGITAGWNCLSISAGSAGLWQLEPLDETGRGADNDVLLTNVHEQYCERSEWNYWSVFASSSRGGYLAEFSLDEREADSVSPMTAALFGLEPPPKQQRHLRGVQPSTSLFEGEGAAWGCQDKIYAALGNAVHVLKFHPSRNESASFSQLGRIALDPALGNAIGGAVGPFGTVTEHQDGLQVLMSSEGTFRISGEPITWRLYPRAHYYTNQLHVVLDHELQVFSFNHDYFVAQDGKLAGYFKRAA